ncbi:bifunctional serine/threonine-protein kinase/formylglycine-generating enzyme family protein [Sulfidibacter corallicola]|uniref:SUMF1/EgtB/PvdO family nonheme iron enzyme n=1 Tax=Sulfidibacter corallicola TaxID=2818388 RepID=A0A8A4TQ06_SULCO|nr:bifunctional serine/threonine-protein kinase/formylglycine-generating enzyme family protein [Sulfidibacter corallicola]QTD51640.1 SUMF1/EgtB/PvdO family nonheme iron enzyme [Sulfidibacter corallicola]
MATSQDTIGRYHIRELLGQGSMGAVLLAFDPHLRREVAIKTINTRLSKYSKDPQNFRNRFEVESQVNSRLNHPNIVGIYDFGVHEGDPYLVMEYIPGRPLDLLFPVATRIPLSTRFLLLEQIASALDHAHQQGVIHRDIKPANILITDRFEAKIVDFGLARLKDSNITTTGVFLGTPSYASPEQIVTGKVSASSDLFALGILTYQLIFGHRPFPGENINSILYHLVHSEPDLSLGEVPLDCDLQALHSTFARILAKEPEERYSRALDFLHDLRLAMGSEVAKREPIAELLTDFLPKEAGIDSEIPHTAGSDGAHSTITQTIHVGRLPADRPWYRRPWVGPVSAVGAALIFFITSYMITRSDNGKPEVPVAETVESAPIGIQPVPPTGHPSEDGSLFAGEAVGDGETPDEETDTAAVEAAAAALLLEREINAAQSEFMKHINAGNVAEAEIAYLKLKTQGAEVETHKALIQALKSLKKNQRQDDQEAARKLTLQITFSDAQKRQDYKKLERLLEEYRRDWPEDKVVIDTWTSAVETVREEWTIQTERFQEDLDFALRTHDPKSATRILQSLSDMEAVDELEKELYRRRIDRIYINGVQMVFLRVEPGTFIMGDPYEPGDARLHRVTVTKPFYLGAFEVTQAQWTAVMGEPSPAKFEAAVHPVENISPEEVQAFINALNSREGTTRYRLPTEAEWEYACRAGTTTLYYTGQELGPDQANFKASGHRKPLPVGSYLPNPWGFYDMYGNVSEWCMDVFRPYGGEDRIDPIVLGSGNRVLRGGYYESPVAECSSGSRAERTRRVRLRTAGFRLLMEVDSE